MSPITGKFLTDILCCAFILLHLSIWGQAVNEPAFKFPKHANASYQPDVNKDLKRILEKNRGALNKKELERFAEITAYGKRNWFTNAIVYPEWKEVEGYIRDVFKKVAPDSLNAEEFGIYPCRLPFFNAFAIYDGTMFVNIGLLAEVKNEAALAVILSHELSHYLNNDIMKHYKYGLINQKKNRFKDSREIRIDNMLFSSEIEAQADLSGFDLILNSPYDLRAGKTNFQYFLLEEERARNKTEQQKSDKKKIRNILKDEDDENDDDDQRSSVDEYLSTHPEAKKRISILDSVIEAKLDSNTQRFEYVIGSEAFAKIRNSARRETLYLLLSENDYEKCLEKAFVFHLDEKQNPVYIYYILESLRRMILINEERRNEGFLVYLNPIKFKKGQSIFDKPRVLFGMNNGLEILTESEEYKTVAFKTHGEAFRYYENVADSMKIPESYLTRALFHIKNKELRIELCNKYLEFSDIKYKNYALAIKAEDFSLQRNNRKIVVMDEHNFYFIQKNGFHQSYVEGAKKLETFNKTLKPVVESDFREIEIISIQDYKNKGLDEFVKFQRVLNSLLHFTMKRQLKKVEDTFKEGKTYYFEKESDENCKSDSLFYENAFLLDPELWNYYKEKNIRDLVYLSSRSLTDKSRFLIRLPILKFIFCCGSANMLTPFSKFIFEFDMYKITCGKDAVRHSISGYYKLTRWNYIQTVYSLLKETE